MTGSCGFGTLCDICNRVLHGLFIEHMALLWDRDSINAWDSSPYDARVIQKLDVCSSVMRDYDSSHNSRVQLQVVIKRRLWVMARYRSCWSPPACLPLQQEGMLGFRCPLQ